MDKIEQINIGAVKEDNSETAVIHMPQMPQIKKQRGRPRDEGCLRQIYLIPGSFKPRKAGKPLKGQTFLRVFIQRSIKKYEHGITPIIKQETVQT